MLDYTLKRSKRRTTVAIKVAEQKLTVYAPFYVSQTEIDGWLKTKQDWVAEQIARQSSQAERRQLPLVNATIKLFGQSVPIIFAKGPKSTWQQDAQSRLTLSISSRVKYQEANYLALLEGFLHEKLESYIEMRVHDYCLQMTEALPAKLKIQHYKRRWGSCNKRRELAFNLHLASAPTWVIDYVIIHELAHLRHMNHSAKFWQRVCHFYPDYKNAESWLKANGSSLSW